MMDLKPSCECCDEDLPPESPDARVCTFECTYCATCADEMQGICKNCGGNLVVRPIRPPERLVKYPASTVRVFDPNNCPVHNPALSTSGGR
jgi:uncharacterized protein